MVKSHQGSEVFNKQPMVLISWAIIQFLLNIKNCINSLVQDCSTFSVLAIELLLSCTKSSICLVSNKRLLCFHCCLHFHVFIPPPNKVGGGVYWIHLVRPSVCPSVRPSVCRRHGFRSISQVCFGISISNFICMLMVAIGRSLVIFSDVACKMAAWRPYWIFWFPDSNFTLALNINFKLQRHNTYVYG